MNIDVVKFLKEFDWHTIIVVGIAYALLTSQNNDIKRELAVIKTVLITKGIMPECYAKKVE